MSHNTRTNSCNFHRVSHPIGRIVLFFPHQADTVTGTCLGNTLLCPPAVLVRRKFSALGDTYTGQSQATAQFISVKWLAFRISEVLGSDFVYYTCGLGCDV
jgi:hypothetical protein